jgi:hypothetical protein
MRKLNFLILLSYIAALNAGMPIHWQQPYAQEIITAYEVRYAIPHDELFNTLQCESGLDPHAKNLGDSHGGSYGIAQINAGSHPNISRAQMLDPVFSVNWAAREFSEGHQHLWSCFTGADTS